MKSTFPHIIRFLPFVLLLALSCAEQSAPEARKMTDFKSDSKKRAEAKAAEEAAGETGAAGDKVSFANIQEIEQSCAQSADTYYKQLPKEEKDKLQLPEDKAKRMLANVCKETLKKKYLEDEKEIDEARELPKPPLGVLNIAEASAEKPPDVGGDIIASAMKEALIPFFETVVKLDKKKAEEAADGTARVFGFLSKGVGIGFNVSASAGYYVSGGASLTAEFVYHRPANSYGEIGFYCAPGLSLGIGTGATAGFGRTLIKTLGCRKTSDYEGGFVTIHLPIPKMDAAFSIGVDPPKFIEFIDYLFKANWNEVTPPEKISEEMDEIDKLIVQKVKDSPNVYEIISIFTYLVFVDAAISVSSLAKGEAGTASEVGGRSLTKVRTMANLLLSKIISLNVFKDALTWPAFRDVMQNFHDKTLLPADKFPFNRTLVGKFIDSGAGFCNSISLADSLTSISTDVLTIKAGIDYSYYVNPKFSGFDGTLAKPEDKIILYLSSLADLADPAKWEKMAGTFNKNIVKPVDEKIVKPVGEAYNRDVKPVADAAGRGISRAYEDSGAQDVVDKDIAPALNSAGEYFHEGQLGEDVGKVYEEGKEIARDTFGLTEQSASSWTAEQTGVKEVGDLGGAVGEKTGFNKIGPLNFVAKLTNVVNPLYLFDECLKPTAEHMAEIGKSVYRLFATEPPPPD